MPKWKRDREQFINAIRSEKKYQNAIKSGMDPKEAASFSPPPPTEIDPSFLKCENCGRYFNEEAAKRHIPICQRVFGNKNKNQSNNKKMPSPQQNNNHVNKNLKQNSFSPTFEPSKNNPNISNKTSIPLQKNSPRSTATSVSPKTISTTSPKISSRSTSTSNSPSKVKKQPLPVKTTKK